jgi:ribosome-binding protein aMBF1 (putative translation factor)
LYRKWLDNHNRTDALGRDRSPISLTPRSDHCSGVKPRTLDDEDFFREIGHRLRQRREALGWTQSGLARRCALHKAYIGFVVPGERNASLINLRRIAKILRVRLSDLMKGLD